MKEPLRKDYNGYGLRDSCSLEDESGEGTTDD